MVSFAQLRDLDTSNLTGAAASAGTLSGNLSGRGEEVVAAANVPAGIWQGDDANAMSTMVRPHGEPLWDASDAFNKGKAALEDLSEGLGAARETLQDAMDLVAGTGITISDEGVVITPPEASAEDKERNERLARQAGALIAEALDAAGLADERAVSVLTTIGEEAEIWAEPEITEHNGGIIGELKGGAGWRNEHDFGRFGELEWKIGPHGTAGGYLPADPTDQPGAWANGRFGVDVTYKSPSTDLGMDGVDLKGDVNFAAGPSAGVSVNDPRLLSHEFEDGNLNVKANLSHTFDQIPGVPITVGVNPELNVDVEEFTDNLKVDMPRLDAIKPW